MTSAIRTSTSVKPRDAPPPIGRLCLLADEWRSIVAYLLMADADDLLCKPWLLLVGLKYFDVDIVERQIVNSASCRIAHLGNRFVSCDGFPGQAQRAKGDFSFRTLHRVQRARPGKNRFLRIDLRINAAQALQGVEILMNPGEQREAHAGEQYQRHQCFEQAEARLPAIRG